MYRDEYDADGARLFRIRSLFKHARDARAEQVRPDIRLFSLSGRITYLKFFQHKGIRSALELYWVRFSAQTAS